MCVHVAGNACIDTTFCLESFPVAGETINASSHFSHIGGKGANQAIASARTGAKVTLWAAIGRDADGARIRQNLAAEINVSQLTQLDEPSDRSAIILDTSGENRIVSGVSCAKTFDPLAQSVMLDAVCCGDILIMQGNLRNCVTQACLAGAKRKGAQTILNASPVSSKDHLELGSVDIIIVNEGEAARLSGIKEMERAAKNLVCSGAHTVIVTLGARGCLMVSDHGRRQHRVYAPSVGVVDTSGAGDVLCGVFAGCLSKHMPARDALQVAVGAAALAVTRPGTLVSCPDNSEIANLMRFIETEQM